MRRVEQRRRHAFEDARRHLGLGGRRLADADVLLREQALDEPAAGRQERALAHGVRRDAVDRDHRGLADLVDRGQVRLDEHRASGLEQRAHVTGRPHRVIVPERPDGFGPRTTGVLATFTDPADTRVA